MKISELYYVFKRMYVYKRHNVRVEFDHPNAYIPKAKLQYKVKLFGIFPFWKTVFDNEYGFFDRPTAVEDPFTYASRMIISNKGQRLGRDHRRKIRQMEIKLK